MPPSVSILIKSSALPAKGFFIICTRSSGFMVCTEMLMGLMCILMMRRMSPSLRFVRVV